MNAHDYDIVVIGGGIQGASVAEAAAAYGYRVLLLERHHPAYGTSSRSSKLIHGGLRYLESGQLSLVRECLRERSILLERAPELVQLQDFHLPIYRRTRRRPWQIRAGLSLYALLAGCRSGTGFCQLKYSEWSSLDGLDLSGLENVFRYKDGHTDDAALTCAVIESARQLGAEIRFPAFFLGAERSGEGWRLSYRDEGEAQSVRTATLVNAAGPWVNHVLARITHAPAPVAIDWVQGTHIVLPRALRAGAYYIEAEDGRAVFVLPWQEQTLVGTTETVYHGEPEHVAPRSEEIDYLLRTYRHHFPGNAALQPEQAFAGLRVLPAAGDKPFARPRETRLLLDNEAQPRLTAIYGGKLTAARATAEEVLSKLKRTLPDRPPVADTRHLTLSRVGVAVTPEVEY